MDILVCNELLELPFNNLPIMSFGWGDDVPESRLLSLRGPFDIITTECRSLVTVVVAEPSIVKLRFSMCRWQMPTIVVSSDVCEHCLLY